jgi:hypothetical protein
MGDMTEPAPRETVRMTVSIGGQVSPADAAVRHLWQTRPIPPELAHDQPRMIDEWLVTGDPGNGYPPYRYTWRSDEYAEPEAAARAYIDIVGEWAAGPHLAHRTVTYSGWEQVQL